MFNKGDILKVRSGENEGKLYVLDGVEDYNYPQGIEVNEDYELLDDLVKEKFDNVEVIGFSEKLAELSTNEMFKQRKG